MFSNMKRFIFPLAMVAILAAAPVSAAEIIHSFAVTATPMAGSRNLTFQENIQYDFGDTERHGIYRDIPETHVRDNATYDYRLHPVAVTRDGSSEKYTTSHSNGNLELKIGNADQTINGAHAYAIRYETDRAYTFFPDHDELYWNVTGNEWNVAIEQAQFTYPLPAGTDIAQVNVVCYTGETGSQAADCTTAKTNGAVVVTATRVLEPNEGMTVVIGLPKGVIPEPTQTDRIWMIVQDNGVLAFPLLALILMGALWWTRGRDPQKRTVVPEYEPPKDLTPALAAATMESSGTPPARAVTATIIDMARRGYLKIRFGEKKHLIGKEQTYTFVKAKPADGLADYEREIYDGLFAAEDEMTLEELKKTTFYTSIQSFRTKIRKELTTRGIYAGDPQKVRATYIVIGIVVIWGGISFLGDTGLGVASTIITGLIVIAFGMLMTKRTPEGVKVLSDLMGFKWFLSVTEKDRFDFHNAPERTPEQFMEFLPYAIAFGVEKKWAEQFASIPMDPPAWAEGASAGSWSAVGFSSAVSSMNTAATSMSSAGSGGSGFSGGGSGGGGGGGGGGSW